jgi:cell division transport system permease protein
MANRKQFWLRSRRTPYQTLASVFMIFVTMFVVGVFISLFAFSSAILSYFETKPQLTVFFKDEKKQEEINVLIQKIQTTGKLANYNYISKDQALAIYREQNKNDPLLLEMVTADILPSSLEISAISPKYLVEIKEIVDKEEGIDEIVFQKDIVDTLVSWTSTIKKIGFIFIIFLLMSTFAILFTTISIKIALRREEIEILNLVGATSWYIKRPFVLEGMFYGIIGSTQAFIVIILFLLYLQPFLTSFFQGIPSLTLINFQNYQVNIWPISFSIYILLWFILLISGIFVGLLGSLFAVSRYLKK